MGRLFLRVMISLAELERNLIIERIKSGLDVVRAREKGLAGT
ncbi:hypothetical protein BN424_2315 [Carnobacterium maltaromaticum LMA28]|jgi:DNA invertase Pin-like site-specific DNA recombinase|uniref:Resolvase/invertase-type recombinase catalytic domain-containing protein n=1 Tax=Carnobacterium maltaromaticum LMA28 TaxID=1234679 RepID=K8E558_CARML|nr:hypothetical protein BN424_2315 [Carnobacterium maltaromaticum LMA28]